MSPVSYLRHYSRNSFSSNRVEYCMATSSQKAIPKTLVFLLLYNGWPPPPTPPPHSLFAFSFRSCFPKGVISILSSFFSFLFCGSGCLVLCSTRKEKKTYMVFYMETVQPVMFLIAGFPLTSQGLCKVPDERPYWRYTKTNAFISIFVSEFRWCML